jgi:hypothetical protein
LVPASINRPRGDIERLEWLCPTHLSKLLIVIEDNLPGAAARPAGLSGLQQARGHE